MSEELRMLERLFIAEVEGRFFQSKAAMLKRLEAKGLVEHRQRLEPTAIGNMTVSFWELTHAGRLLYCMSCDDKPNDIGGKE